MTPISDRELWICEGGDFKIPLFVDRYKAEGEPHAEWLYVQPAVGLNKRQFDALCQLVRPAADHSGQSEEARFWFQEMHLRTVAKPVYGTTPAYWFQWGDERHTSYAPLPEIPQPEAQEELSKEAAKFVDFLVKKSAVLDRTQVKLAMREIGRAGLEWLLHERKPIDLGWATIYPLPYRANWKEIIFGNLLPKKDNRPPSGETERAKWAEEHLVPHLFDTLLLAVNREEHYFYPRLELVLNKHFWNYAREIERERRRIHGPAGYVKDHIRQVKARCVRWATEAFAAWRQETTRAAGAVDENYTGSGQRVVPNRKPNRIVAEAPQNPRLDIVVEDEDMVHTTSPKRELEEKVKGLRKMPMLPPAASDVRPAGQEVGESANDGGGADGLSLLSPPQGSDTGGEVLAVGGDGGQA